MKEQVDQVFANLLIALKSQGADFSEVVKMTSVDSRPEPEPDLLCIHVDGPVAFELVSLTDSAIAKMQAAGQKAHQDAFYTSDPAVEIIRKKLTKKYTTSAEHIELLIYTNRQIITPTDEVVP